MLQRDARGGQRRWLTRRRTRFESSMAARRSPGDGGVPLVDERRPDEAPPRPARPPRLLGLRSVRRLRRPRRALASAALGAGGFNPSRSRCAPQKAIPAWHARLLNDAVLGRWYSAQALSMPPRLYRGEPARTGHRARRRRSAVATTTWRRPIRMATNSGADPGDPPQYSRRRHRPPRAHALRARGLRPIVATASLRLNGGKRRHSSGRRSRFPRPVV